MSSSVTARFTSSPFLPEETTITSVVSEVPERLEDFTDEILLGQICNDNRDALALLFRRYAHTIRNIGCRILRDKAEADDLLQDVFLYIHRKSTVFDSTKGSARSWIIQVAYTQALLRRRELKSQGFYLSGIADKPVECKHSKDKGADYDHSVEGLFGRNGWRKIEADLTEDQRETFRLHFFEGYTFAEIADKLGQSYSNVRNHHYRGLEKLRKHLAEDQLNRRRSVCHELKSDEKPRDLTNGPA
jgi:RNA polymerase sigma-70 factor (ECF subfamily)